MIKNVDIASCNVPVMFVRFWWNLNFLDRFFEKRISRYQISWKSVCWEPSCCMGTDIRYEANSRYSQLCERAKTRVHVAEFCFATVRSRRG